jgi:CRP/FNR family transcriptional regulator, cyclic AMP receptor protein
VSVRAPNAATDQPRRRPNARSTATPLHPLGPPPRSKRFAGEVGPVWLLEADRDLGAGIPPAHAMHARRNSLARVIAIQRRHWDTSEISTAARTGWLGLYVLSGLLVRRTTVGSRDAGELLAPGDLFRPWDEELGYDPLPVLTDWLVLSPVRLAVLDGHFVGRMAPWPAVGATLTGRLSERVRQRAALHAISHLPRADTRLLLTFWIMAERVGTVRPDGIVLRLPLTHSVLATLIGSHRPTVTIALHALADEGLLHRNNRDEWLLTNAAIAAIAPPRIVSGVRADAIDGLMSA